MNGTPVPPELQNKKNISTKKYLQKLPKNVRIIALQLMNAPLAAPYDSDEKIQQLDGVEEVGKFLIQKIKQQDEQGFFKP